MKFQFEITFDVTKFLTIASISQRKLIGNKQQITVVF